MFLVCLISPKAETTVNISCLDLVRKKKKNYNKTTWNIKLHIRTPGTGMPMAIKTSKALAFNILVHVLL